MKIKTSLLSVLIVLLTACTGVPVVNLEEKKVTEAATEITDFNLPDGYAADFSANLFGYTLAVFNSGDDHSHLYLIQSENESDWEKLAGMLDQLAPGSSDARTHMTIIGNKPISIRGEETALILSEGINSDGEGYRQATAAFQGLGGPAMVVISAPVNHWNQEKVDTLLNSLQ